MCSLQSFVGGDVGADPVLNRRYIALTRTYTKPGIICSFSYKVGDTVYICSKMLPIDTNEMELTINDSELMLMSATVKVRQNVI